MVERDRKQFNFSYLEVEMAGLGRVGLVGVIVVLVGAVLVVIHLAPVSLSSFLTYVSLSRLYALVNYGTLSLHNVKRNAQSLHLDGTLSLHDVKQNAQSLHLDGTFSLHT
jgi:hypothetical protein